MAPKTQPSVPALVGNSGHVHKGGVVAGSHWDMEGMKPHGSFCVHKIKASARGRGASLATQEGIFEILQNGTEWPEYL